MYPMLQYDLLIVQIHIENTFTHICTYTKKANILINSDITSVFNKNQVYAKSIYIIIFILDKLDIYIYI